MHPVRLAAASSLLGVLSACATSPPAATVAAPDASLVSRPSPSASMAPIPVPDLVPPTGQAWFGMNLDWGNDSVAAVGERLGATPAAWVQFVRFPLDDVGRGHLAGFFEQVGAVGGIGVVTLEPHDGLEAVTPAASEELATILDDAARVHGVPTLVRFAHEMNGSWYAWGQRPDAYVAAFRIVADAIHAGAPASAMAWAPNDGSRVPIRGGPARRRHGLGRGGRAGHRR